MKICFVCNEYPPGPHGGIGSLIQTLARALVARGHVVRVIGVYKSAYPASNYEEDHGVRVWRMRQSQLWKAGWLVDRINLFRKIKHWGLAGEIDLIEVPDYQGWAACWGKLPIPVVARLNGSGCVLAKMYSRSISHLDCLVEKMSLDRADFVISASNNIAKQTQDAFGPSIDCNNVIYNPVEIPLQVMPWSQRSRGMVLFAGTLSESKGLLSLLSAWQIVKAVCGHARLNVYGKFGVLADGSSMQSYLSDKTSQLELMDVRFYGFVNRKELTNALQMANLAVFPSFFESFGLAAVEAMAFGCPTIFTKNASGPEIINHGLNGLLVSPHDPVEISQAVISLLQNEAFAENIGAMGRQMVMERFSLEKIVPLNEQCYKRCVENLNG
jgi:glycosyltransferase involved in cell wall biosynthesis